ncbi:YciI family protein [Anaerorhabdus sp.]|uniref:YciI family protein n=1 Tax=Anaerorhabdus sp. TaxID=1872524 RepID=UPI002FC7CF8F
MEKYQYVMFIEKTKNYNKLTKVALERHIENLRKLDDEGYLDKCGVFKKYPGVAGMIILNANSYEEADELCKREPLVIEGFATYSLKVIQIADRENNYLY